MVFVIGQSYIRRELHEKYHGQRQGGISTPSDYNIVMLFTGEQGEQYGYRDGWTPDGLFTYTGEGQKGDMSFVRGNAAIRDHSVNGKDLHLFMYLKKGYVRYIGQMICTGYQERRGPDIDGNERKVLVFELTPIGAFEPEVPSNEVKEGKNLWREDLKVLRQRALSSSSTAQTPVERKILARQRSTAIRIYALKRANGTCEACNSKAPFVTDNGQLYLECHHIRRLSDGGPDHPQWVIGLCPNCHRRAHHSHDKELFREDLTTIVAVKELS